MTSQALLAEAAQQKTAARKPSALIWTDPEVGFHKVIESSDFLVLFTKSIASKYLKMVSARVSSSFIWKAH